MKEHPPYVMVVVSMKPYTILFLQKPDRNQVLETLADLIQHGNDKQLYNSFEILQFDITEDIKGSFAER